ncbi:serine-threonine kinase receptor-associated protein [Struthio camelus]|uniref:serine-threonine kinase receptor-associated protein n=1 Tax=Struthio camelus TaxID=8801 RepID=UPI003603F5DC
MRSCQEGVQCRTSLSFQSVDRVFSDKAGRLLQLQVTSSDASWGNNPISVAALHFMQGQTGAAGYSGLPIFRVSPPLPLHARPTRPCSRPCWDRDQPQNTAFLFGSVDLLLLQEPERSGGAPAAAQRSNCKGIKAAGSPPPLRAGSPRLRNGPPPAPRTAASGSAPARRRSFRPEAFPLRHFPRRPGRRFLPGRRGLVSLRARAPPPPTFPAARAPNRRSAPPTAAAAAAMAMRQTPLTCSGHTRPVVDLAFSGITPYGYFLISACKDGKPMLRQGDTGDWIGTFLGHKGAVWGATLNKDATKAATAAADFTAKVWDAVSGDELISLAHKHIVKSVDFTQDSDYLLTGGQDKLLRIYDLSKPEAEPQVISGHTSGIKKALWSSDDKQILSADDKTVRLWDRNTMTEVKALNVAMSVSNMEYVPEGQILVITYGKTIAFHSAETLEQIKSFEAPATINSASLHPEKECLVAGGEDFKLYKYDYNTGEELESYKGHFGPIHCVRFSPDGELYASGSEDGTLRLWQTTVGKTYGLWKCVVPEEENAEAAKARTTLPGTAEEELEDLASENSDSMYSSTPEVKA